VEQEFDENAHFRFVFDDQIFLAGFELDCNALPTVKGHLASLAARGKFIRVYKLSEHPESTCSGSINETFNIVEIKVFRSLLPNAQLIKTFNFDVLLWNYVLLELVSVEKSDFRPVFAELDRHFFTGERIFVYCVVGLHSLAADGICHQMLL
jgi:hypothetical protein